MADRVRVQFEVHNDDDSMLPGQDTIISSGSPRIAMKVASVSDLDTILINTEGTQEEADRISTLKDRLKDGWMVMVENVTNNDHESGMAASYFSPIFDDEDAGTVREWTQHVLSTHSHKNKLLLDKIGDIDLYSLDKNRDKLLTLTMLDTPAPSIKDYSTLLKVDWVDVPVGLPDIHGYTPNKNMYLTFKNNEYMWDNEFVPAQTFHSKEAVVVEEDAHWKVVFPNTFFNESTDSLLMFSHNSFLSDYTIVKDNEAEKLDLNDELLTLTFDKEDYLFDEGETIKLIIIRNGAVGMFDSIRDEFITKSEALAWRTGGIVSLRNYATKLELSRKADKGHVHYNYAHIDHSHDGRYSYYYHRHDQYVTWDIFKKYLDDELGDFKVPDDSELTAVQSSLDNIQANIDDILGRLKAIDENIGEIIDSNEIQLSEEFLNKRATINIGLYKVGDLIRSNGQSSMTLEEFLYRIITRPVEEAAPPVLTFKITNLNEPILDAANSGRELKLDIYYSYSYIEGEDNIGRFETMTIEVVSDTGAKIVNPITYSYEEMTNRGYISEDKKINLSVNLPESLWGFKREIYVKVSATYIVADLSMFPSTGLPVVSYTVPIETGLYSYIFTTKDSNIDKIDADYILDHPGTLLRAGDVFEYTAAEKGQVLVLALPVLSTTLEDVISLNQGTQMLDLFDIVGPVNIGAAINYDVAVYIFRAHLDFGPNANFEMYIGEAGGNIEYGYKADRYSPTNQVRSFRRLGPFPFDDTTVFPTMKEARKYVRYHKAAYVGQIIAIVSDETEETTAYMVIHDPDEDKLDLTKIADSSNNGKFLSFETMAEANQYVKDFGSKVKEGYMALIHRPDNINVNPTFFTYSIGDRGKPIPVNRWNRIGLGVGIASREDDGYMSKEQFTQLEELSNRTYRYDIDGVNTDAFEPVSRGTLVEKVVVRVISITNNIDVLVRSTSNEIFNMDFDEADSGSTFINDIYTSVNDDKNDEIKLSTSGLEPDDKIQVLITVKP